MSRTIRQDSHRNGDRDKRPEDSLPPEEREELAEDAELDDYDDPDDLDGADEDDTALEENAGGRREPSEAAGEDDYASGPDDALGLYLRQMGAIPLLTRDKELSLAQRLEHHRNRFRAAALLCPRVLSRMFEKFEQIAAGQTPIDPNIDVYSSEELRLSRIQIIARLVEEPPHA